MGGQDSRGSRSALTAPSANRRRVFQIAAALILASIAGPAVSDSDAPWSVGLSERAVVDNAVLAGHRGQGVEHDASAVRMMISVILWDEVTPAGSGGRSNRHNGQPETATSRVGSGIDTHQVSLQLSRVSP